LAKTVRCVLSTTRNAGRRTVARPSTPKARADGGYYDHRVGGKRQALQLEERNAMTSDGSIEALKGMMEARVYEWRQSEKKRPSQPGPVVTISREAGCRGESISERMAAELGLHLYTWEIVEQIAKDEHVSVQVVSTLDEKARSELEDWLDGFQGDRNLSEYAYLRDLKRITFAIAAHGSAIIVGRGASLLLPPEKRIALLFVAPLEVRIRNVMEDGGLSEKHAREHIAKLEAEHHQFAKKYFQTDLLDSAHYHLVINTALIKPDIIAGITKEIIHHKS
jgi:cytidylate kinase